MNTLRIQAANFCLDLAEIIYHHAWKTTRALENFAHRIDGNRPGDIPF